MGQARLLNDAKLMFKPLFGLLTRSFWVSVQKAVLADSSRRYSKSELVWLMAFDWIGLDQDDRGARRKSGCDGPATRVS